MDPGSTETLHERLTERFGSDLRSVCYYGREGSDVVYVREDVEAAYDPGDYRNIFRAARLEAMDAPAQESMYVHGELYCAVQCFEGATVVKLPMGGRGGILWSVDAGAIDDLRETIEKCVAVVSL